MRCDCCGRSVSKNSDFVVELFFGVTYTICEDCLNELYSEDYV